MAQTQIRAEIVAACLKELREQKIHRTFAGYLAVKWTAAQFNRSTDLPPKFKEFFDTFLRVPDASTKAPYAIVFTEQAPSKANQLSGINVAGSYAQSSLRSDSPFRSVVAVTGQKQNIRYSLVTIQGCKQGTRE